jgi:mRNA-degrading endonuclease RelE of RelBE toxin-antitoxin system
VYEVLVSSSGQRALKKLPIQIRQALFEEAKGLSKDPLLGKRLEGEFKHLHSLRVIHGGTHYRLIYQIKQDKKQVIVLFAGSRENLYRRLTQLKIRSQ